MSVVQIKEQWPGDMKSLVRLREQLRFAHVVIS